MFAWNVLILRLIKTFKRKLQAAVSQNRRRFYNTEEDLNLGKTFNDKPEYYA